MDADFGFLLFGCIAAAMSALALSFVLPLLLAAPRAPARTRTSTATNIEVCRSQLAELDRDLAAGLLGSDEHRRARGDLERRLLDETAEECVAPDRRTRTYGVAILIGVALPALAFALYALFGDPGALRRAAPLEAEAAGLSGANAAATRADMVAHLERNPRDGRGWVLLARRDFAADHFREAAQEYAKAVAVSTKVARDPDVWCEYADALGMAQSGSLEGQPRDLIAHALAIDALHPKALELAGSAAYEARDYAAAARHWRTLLAQMGTDNAERRELVAALARVEQIAMSHRDGIGANGNTTRESK